MSKIKNPNWERDELILALDLYFDLDVNEMSANNLKVIELSRILNLLPIHDNIPNREKFRNPNGVSRKLTNFGAIDPNYLGKGSQNGAKLDQIIFDEFKDERKKLKELAKTIRSIIINPKSLSQISNISLTDEDLPDAVKEGKTLYKLHRVIERNQAIIKSKKKRYFQDNGKLDCEVCGFDFSEVYGELGMGYIEAHHRTPLNKINGETTTNIEDLALVCANCHRMLHRNINGLGISELKESLQRG